VRDPERKQETTHQKAVQKKFCKKNFYWFSNHADKVVPLMERNQSFSLFESAKPQHHNTTGYPAISDDTVGANKEIFFSLETILP